MGKHFMHGLSGLGAARGWVRSGEGPNGLTRSHGLAISRLALKRHGIAHHPPLTTPPRQRLGALLRTLNENFSFLRRYGFHGEHTSTIVRY